VRTLALLKLDVEGHELAVLEGASRLLGGGAIRDVMFEEEETLPTPVSQSYWSQPRSRCSVPSSGYLGLGLWRRRASWLARSGMRPRTSLPVAQPGLSSAGPRSSAP
jgi:hypothetical protein